MYETRGNAKFYYSYDANGTLYSVKYTLTDSSDLMTYYFTHNSRGDIVGIYNGAGQLRAHYEYDAWGNVLSVTDQNGNAITSSTHIGNLNPFRYRGYYLDSETGLYYLMSRYYDPVTHRFVNADGYFQSGENVLDANMCAYCRNNPISFVDPTGKKCKIHDPYFVGNCFFCNPDYLDYERKHIDRYNKINGTNYTGINDKGEYYTDFSSNLSKGVSGASTALTFTRGSLYTAGGYYATSAGGAAGISSLGYAVTTPLNIVSHATNPYLTDWQKGVAISEELLLAGIGIAGAILFVSCPGAGLLFGFGLTMFSYGAMGMQVNYWETDNKARWSGSYD